MEHGVPNEQRESADRYFNHRNEQSDKKRIAELEKELASVHERFDSNIEECNRFSDMYESAVQNNKQLKENTVDVSHLTHKQKIQVNNFINRLPKEGDDE